MLKGTIVENSLVNPLVLEGIHVARTWRDGEWTLHEVELTEEQALNLSKSIIEGPWYMHFWKTGSDDVLIIYRDAHFWIQYSDIATWKDAVAYGKSIGIPEEQLDFIVT